MAACNDSVMCCRNDNNNGNNNNTMTNRRNKPSQYDHPDASRRSSSCQNDRSEAVLKAHMKQNEGEIRMLENKLVKQEQAKEEVEELHMRLEDLNRTMEEMTENQKQSFDNISRDLDVITAKYERMRNTIHQLKKENHELQCSTHRATARELENVDKIKKLEINKAQAIECNKGLQDTLQKLQVTPPHNISNSNVLFRAPPTIDDKHFQPNVCFKLFMKGVTGASNLGDLGSHEFHESP